ncbi:hypothetical protein C9890_0197 [Perkinsus sp. BL_2016]|nr:hypothetical protein C9890_0197 [Perkinsus sp. BL_2016]
MRIARITCRGFKTYRDTVTVGPLDPHLNCIVGMNGSGKSSLFGAILFVLSPHSGGQCSSGNYLHEGPTGKALSGFAEIELNNSDKSFPLDTDRVILRRVLAGIGKNDEFMINGKHVTRSEYTTLLQASGLIGRKNSHRLPFFIVEQGRIAATATLSEVDRFQMLKEAAGIDVFDEKRAESIAGMEETEAKRLRVVELLSEIDKKCEELQLETVELQEFSRLKREKEWTEYQAAALEKEQLVKIRAELVSDLGAKRQRLEELEYRLSELATVSEAETEAPSSGTQEACEKLERIKIEISQKIAERNEIQTSLEKANLALSQATELLHEMESKKEELINEMEVQNVSLNEYKLARSKLQQAKEETEQELQSASVEDWNLPERQDQLSLVKTSTERRLAAVEKDLCQKSSELEILVSDKIPMKQAEIRLVEEELISIESSEQDVERSRRAREEQLREKNTSLFNQRQKQFDLQRQIEKLESEFKEASGSVLRSSNWNTRELICRSEISGVRGLVGEFLKIPAPYRVAVESLFKSVLFNIVVDTDEVADSIASKVSSGKGKVTLTPINRLSSSAGPGMGGRLLEDITESGLNAQLLSSVIAPLNDDQETWVRTMIDSFFSRTAIVDTMDTGVEIAKRFKIDAVTLEGDVVSKDLVVKGGDTFGARKRKGGEIVRNWQQSIELKHKIDLLKNEKSLVSQELRVLEADVGEIEKCVVGSAGQPSSLDSKKSDLKAKHNLLKRELHSLFETRAELDKYIIPNLKDVELKSIQDELVRIETELISVSRRIACGGSISQDAQRVSIEVAKRRLEEINAQLSGIDSEFVGLRKRVSATRSELDHFVSSRIDHLGEVADERRREVSHLNEKLVRANAGLVVVECNELKQAELEVKARLDEEAALRALREEEKKSKGTVDEEKKRIEDEMESLMTSVKAKELKLTNVEADIVSAGNSMRNLSSIPSQESIVAGPGQLRQLRARIVELTSELASSKFAYLNKRSIEQFERVASEQHDLHNRHAELEESYSSIKQLLFDMSEKEAAMIRDSFSRVDAYFSALFKKVIGDRASASLCLRLGEDTKTGLSGTIGLENVCFPDGARSKHMHELSGGQRTMIALCFLVALQKASGQSSRNSFFLLDEVDAALDTNYRSSLASALSLEAVTSGTQVLLTSFRPEFAPVSNKHWLVSMAGGSTRVVACTLDDALEFVGVGTSEQLSSLPAQNEISVRE